MLQKHFIDTEVLTMKTENDVSINSMKIPSKPWIALVKKCRVQNKYCNTYVKKKRFMLVQFLFTRGPLIDGTRRICIMQYGPR